MVDSRSSIDTRLTSSCSDCGHEWVAADYASPLDDFLAAVMANGQRCPRCKGSHVLARTPSKRQRDAERALAEEVRLG